jgi:hypothetical protein
MRVSNKPHVDASKRDRERGKTFARGGDDHMLGSVPAEAAPAGRTGPSQVKAPGARAAKGGPKNQGFGLSLPAAPGRTGPLRLGRGR